MAIQTTNPVGLIGAAVIVIAWLPSTYLVLRKKKSSMNISFCLLFMFGAALLAFYSFQVDDVVFGILNCISVIFAITNFVFIPRKWEKLEEIEGKFETIEEVMHLRTPEYWGEKAHARATAQEGPGKREEHHLRHIEKELKSLRKPPLKREAVKKRGVQKLTGRKKRGKR